jgi:hypothetical protein
VRTHGPSVSRLDLPRRHEAPTTHRDLSSCESRTSVQPNPVPSRTSVDLDLSSVRLEVGRGVFGGDPALDSEPSFGDRVLGESERGEGSSSGDLDLSGDDIDPGDLLYKARSPSSAVY